MPPNPPEFSNPGWDPYGLSDKRWNIEGGQVTFNGLNNALTIVWGSPNDNNPAATNTVSFNTGANGTGSLIGRVLASDLYSNFSGVNNTQDPGYLISFMTPENFGSVVFTTGSSDSEFSPPSPSRRPGRCWASASSAWPASPDASASGIASRPRSAEPATRADPTIRAPHPTCASMMQPLVLPDGGFCVQRSAVIRRLRSQIPIAPIGSSALSGQHPYRAGSGRPGIRAITAVPLAFTRSIDVVL
jgi:hypothetical protein